MKIRPSAIGKTASSEQAQAYQRACEMKKNFEDLSRDLVVLDNHTVDSEPRPGRLNVAANLIPHLDTAKYPHLDLTDVRARVEFDTQTKQVRSLDLTTPRYEISARRERGLCGFGSERLVIREQLGDSAVRDDDGKIVGLKRAPQATFRADGTLFFEPEKFDWCPAEFNGVTFHV